MIIKLEEPNEVATRRPCSPVQNEDKIVDDDDDNYDDDGVACEEIAAAQETEAEIIPDELEEPNTADYIEKEDKDGEDVVDGGAAAPEKECEDDQSGEIS